MKHMDPYLEPRQPTWVERPGAMQMIQQCKPLLTTETASGKPVSGSPRIHFSCLECSPLHLIPLAPPLALSPLLTGYVEKIW